MSAAWRTELLRLFLCAFLGALFGLVFGYPMFGIFVAYMGYGAWHLRQIFRLHEWLQKGLRGEPLEGRGIWADIHGRYYELRKRNDRRKQRLTETIEEFQASTAALPDGAVVINARGHIMWFNESAQSLLGLHSGKDVGQPILNLLRHPRVKQYVLNGRYEDPIEVDSPVNASVVLLLRIIPYGKNQRLLIARDISQRKQLDQTRRDFISNASHELRTPLTVLVGYLEMMNEDMSANSQALSAWKAPLEQMSEQAYRMEQIVNDLLKLARLEADGLESVQCKVDMPTIIQRAAASASALSNGKHNIQLSVEPELRIMGREPDLESVVSNLIQNAVRYSPDGGDIQVRWYATEDGAFFEVQDSGVGIEAKDVPRLTERFYRVDVARSRETGGTGLGLAIVKHGLENHEATLNIQSRFGKGSVFACHFPAHRLHSSVQSASA